MPAVSVCDSPLAVAIRHNLDAGQSKPSDDLNLSLAGSASRILCTELDYEETDNCRSTIQDRLKSKCVVFSLSNQENSDNGKAKDGATCSKSLEKSKEPRLPEPRVTLYAAENVSLGWNKNFPIGAGMYNIGNTCYLNSTLQALFHVPALVNWLLSDTHHESKCELNDGPGECLTCAVAKTLQFSHQKTGDAIRPYHVYNKLKLICRTMVPGQQEDAHEFLRYLLEGMEKAYLVRKKALKLDSYSKETTPINQIFGGYIRTEVKCLQCGHVSTTFQHFQDLLLDIRKSNTLDEALNGYFSQEQLDNNDYKCEACKRRVPATKQFILERPPKVLCIQLKRFSVLGGKISRHIGFKTTVDMGPYIRCRPGEQPSKIIYKLASLVTHMGPSVNCGHYTAIAQVSSGKFFCFDDSNVRHIGLPNVVSNNAYIMIFEMEPSSSSNGQPQSSQIGTSKGEISLSKSNLSFPHSNGMSNKLLDGSGSKNITSSKNGEGGSSSASSSTKQQKDQRESNGSSMTSTPPPPPPPPLPSLPPPNNARRNFIGPQLPPHMEKNRLYESSKNSKLVDYDGDSSEDDEKDTYSSSNTFRKFRDEQETIRSSQNNSPSSKSHNNKLNGNGYSHSPQASRSPSTHNGVANHHYPPLSNGFDANNGDAGSSTSSSYSNGSSSRGSSPKNESSNGRTEHNGSSDKCKDKWHYAKARSDSSERKIYTKASINNKGWHVSKENSSPSSATTANGWLVSDTISGAHVDQSRPGLNLMLPNNKTVASSNKPDESNSSSNRSNNLSSSQNAADVRSFNGNNRSDTVSHLQKSSLWAYGNTNVHSWNGGKARMDREVDSERRQDRKRTFDDDDELDRSRPKKIKMHHNDYKNRNDSKYNRFQEYQNKSAQWKPMNHYRHNSQSYNRPRHGNYNRPNNRHYHHNKSRNHWRR